MNLIKKLLPFLILILTFSYCSDSNETVEEQEGQEEQEEIIYSIEAPFYPIDFEAEGNGAEWSWSVFENGSNTMLEVIENPYKTGINTSETVAKFTALREGQPYAGCETKHGEDIGSFKFDETNSVVKILVYKTSISDVALKFAEYAAPGVGAEAQPEVKVANTKINEWEELTFDVSGSIGKGATMIIDQIIIFPDFTARTADNVIYFDHITFGNN
jgi:hypothetical protein